MKVENDRVEALRLEPTILPFRTYNSYKDSTLLNPDEMDVADNVIMDDGIIEKVPGTTKGNSDTPGAAVMGLHRVYGRDGTKVCLRLANGSLKSGPAAFSTTVLSSLATAKRTPFININGRAYGINETNGIIRYDPILAEGLLTAITGPYLRKKIAFFETDETWTQITGTAATNTGSFRAEEFSGKSRQSLKLTASASGGASASSPLALDLTAFVNSKASDNDDYICFYTLHDIRNNVSNATVEFSTGGTGFTTKFMITLPQVDFEEGDHEWTYWKVKKGAFLKTGSPDWSDVQAVRAGCNANANGALNVSFDFVFLKIAPPRGAELKKQIAICSNADGTWTGANVDITNTYYYGDDSYSSLRLGGVASAVTAEITKASTIDLSKWENQAASATTDEIVFRISCNNIANLADTNCLQMRIGESSSVYWRYIWTTKALLGLTGNIDSKNNNWFEVRIKKSAFTAIGGITLWSAIDYISFITSAFTGTATYVYIDDIKLEQYAESQAIADFESDETWTVTTNGGGQVTTEKGVTEGVQCLQLYGSKANKVSQSVGSISWVGAVKDLSTWDGATASTTDDYITFDIHYENYKHIEYLELWFDNNSLATYANAYKFRFLPTDIIVNNKNNQKKEMKIAKSQFEQIGSTGGWNTIGACRFIYQAKGKKHGGSIFIDNMIMKRKTGMTGRYYYKYVFMVKDIASACSELSDAVDSKGSFLTLNNIKTSQDSRVTARKIYRLGGNFPSTWMLAKTIEDNTTTTIIDEVDDDDLGLSINDNVPTGNIPGVYGNNLTYDPQSDRAIYWGDPSYKNRLYYSNPGYYHAVNELNYRDFPHDLMAVIPWYGQNILLFKNTIKKINGDVATGELIDIPSTVGACSYWGACKATSTLIAFASWDNVYLFDGYKPIAIGDEIRNYFKGMEAYLATVSIAYHKDHLYIACQDIDSALGYNSNVLRYDFKTKSWALMPNWNVNVWSNWNEQDDQNELYYGDSVTGNIYSIDSVNYVFDTSVINSQFVSGWIGFPYEDIRILMIEVEAKGTAGSSLAFYGFKNHSTDNYVSCSIALSTTWTVFRIGPKNVINWLQGRNIRIRFDHLMENAYFKVKNLTLYAEKIPKRVTLNEQTVTIT